MKKIFCFFFIALLCFYPAGSQITGLPNYQKELNIGEELKSTFQQQLQAEKETFPVTTVVNDTFYIVGPNDFFSILISPTNINPEITKVSSDGQLILPRYGFLKVSGKTLLDVKKEVELLVKSFNPNATVSTSLFKPRICLVRIFGNVKKPGVYYLPASYRVSDAIAVANQEYSTQDAPIKRLETSLFFSDLERRRQFELIDKGLPSDFFYSTRNILIYNQMYGFRNADLELSKSRSSFEFDHYVREGDEIYVPYLPVDYEYVTISGAVVQPGKYFFKKGDRLSDLLKFSKGFKQSTDFSNVLLINGQEAKKV
ncbi:MAG: SLBB domain-containing protein, partial [Candidatus Kapaibacteriota bacterium]